MHSGEKVSATIWQKMRCTVAASEICSLGLNTSLRILSRQGTRL